MVFLGWTNVFGQIEGDFRRSEFNRDPVQVILRAKALAMVFIEDEWASAVSAGMEIRFYEQFSILADIVHFSYKHELEVPINGSSSNYNEYWQKDDRNYMAYELRYYPSFLEFDMVQFYVNGFSKIGKRFVHTEELYPLGEDEVSRMTSSIRDYGTSIGMHFGDTWGADLNLGAVYRNEIKFEDIHHHNAPTTYTSNVHDDRWLMNIRFSLFFNLNRL